MPWQPDASPSTPAAPAWWSAMPRLPVPSAEIPENRMVDTVVSSATREVVIGFERPFCVIGERINPTGRKLLAAEMAAGDYGRVGADALAQVARSEEHTSELQSLMRISYAGFCL